MKKYLITKFLDGPGSNHLDREFIQAKKKHRIKVENAVKRKISNLPESLSDMESDNENITGMC